MTLSLVVIAKDEERDLPACLASARGLVQEIVVVDSGSADRTAEVARAAGAKVLRREFTTYAEQKQFAVEAAAGEWILNLDADERLTSELADSIRRALQAPAADAFRLPFAVEFLGRRLRHGGLNGERHVRLFRRGAGRFTGGLLHEGVALDGPVGDLPGAVLHRPYADLSEYLSKLDRYTTLAARKAHESGRRFRWYHHFLLPAEFWKRYLLQLGFLDGVPGLTWCALSAFYAWLKYAKLRELQTAAAERQEVSS